MNRNAKMQLKCIFLFCTKLCRAKYKCEHLFQPTAAEPYFFAVAGQTVVLFPFYQFAVQQVVGPVHRDRVTFSGNIHRTEVPDVPPHEAIERKGEILFGGNMGRVKAHDALLRFDVPHQQVCVCYLVDAVCHIQRVARNGDAPFDVVFGDLHLHFVPPVPFGIREVEHQHVVMLYVSPSGQSVDVHLFTL